MTDRIFLPLRRGVRSLVFEYHEQKGARNWRFRAVAARESLSGPLLRTGRGSLNDEELGHCEGLLQLLPDVEEALSKLSLTQQNGLDDLFENWGSKVSSIGGTPLLTATLYLNLLRQCLADETFLGRYEKSDPSERFALPASVGIYETMLRAGQLNRAYSALQSDLPFASPPEDPSPIWPRFFLIAGDILQRLNHRENALEMLLRAAEIAPTASLLRRIAVIHLRLGDPEQAIEMFERSAEMEPLDESSLLYLLECYGETGRDEDAERTLDLARKLKNNASAE